MPTFGQQSQGVLATVDMRLRVVAFRAVETFDCSAVSGHRGEHEQNALFEAGRSHLRWPDSKHNVNPSRALDLAPYPIDWDDRDRFHYFAGFVMATAKGLGVPLVWGGDWDGDWEVRDNHFDDLAHFEIAT